MKKLLFLLLLGGSLQAASQGSVVGLPSDDSPPPFSPDHDAQLVRSSALPPVPPEVLRIVRSEDITPDLARSVYTVGRWLVEYGAEHFDFLFYEGHRHRELMLVWMAQYRADTATPATVPYSSQ